ncbi:MAG: triose-phosphate isomerase [Bradymonadales bacterium]|nr:triose-phosphate isomerase [Bradymonadales bacterium]
MLTSRTPIVAGNWKMHLAWREAIDLVRAMRGPLNQCKKVEVILIPPFPALVTVAELVQPTAIRIGAQNCHWESKGAFTGEVSPSMLVGTCRYVLVGHSERRSLFGESDEVVRKKLAAILQHGLVPLLCVGENLAQREEGRTSEVVATQVAVALDGLSLSPERLVIAYEPVWAIGTGRACAPAAANSVCGLVIRGVLAELFGEQTAAAVRILYGGSVTAANARSYFEQADIDGALVGGASLQADSFIAITRAAQAVAG